MKNLLVVAVLTVVFGAISIVSATQLGPTQAQAMPVAAEPYAHHSFVELRPFQYPVSDMARLRILNKTHEAIDHHYSTLKLGYGYLGILSCYPPEECQPLLGEPCSPVGSYGCCRDGSGAMVKCFCDARYDPEHGWYGVWVKKTW